VTEQAYDNPKFVEDMVRDIAASLNAGSAHRGLRVVESENFESIHNHSAYALLMAGRLVALREREVRAFAAHLGAIEEGVAEQREPHVPVS
jgi:hypothetical protein